MNMHFDVPATHRFQTNEPWP